MHNFFLFLARHVSFFVFLLLEALCAVLIFNFNDFHRASFFSSANLVTGSYYNITGSVGRYFSLDEANQALLEQNVRLMADVERLERLVAASADSSLRVVAASALSDDSAAYAFRTARVINQTTNRSRNMLTLDAGYRDGVRQDMAVVNAQGVVGLVTAVSTHYSLVMPLINTGSHLSVKLKGSNHRGQLVWDGFSAARAQVVDVPEHAPVQVGDTIVTSGASSFFPDGYTVGFVCSVEPDRNGGFFDIDIDLAVDFNSVYLVELIEDLRKQEREEFENSVPND